MARSLELVIQAKNLTGPAFNAVQASLKKSEESAESAAKAASELDSSFSGTTTRAGELADGIGRVSTTLARSADAFGLPADALRTLDDVADVAELGLNNLSKAAAGFNTASLGVAGAGFAIGSAIGGWLREIPAVEKAADSAAASLHKLFTGVDPTKATEGLDEFRKKIAATHEEAIRKQVEQQKALGTSAEELARTYKNIPPHLKEQLGISKELVAEQKKQTVEAEKAAQRRREALDIAGQIKRAEEEIALKMEVQKKLQEFMAGPPKEMIQTFEILKQHWQGKEIASNLLPAIKEVKKVSEGIKADFTDFGKPGSAFLKSFKGALQDLPNVILGAIQGGGNVGKAIGSHLGGTVGSSLGPSLAKAIGGTFGSALGSVLPGIGALAGEALGGLFDKIFGPSEIEQVNDMRDSFFETFGGFEKFSQKMAQVSSEDWAKKIFDAKSVEEFNRLVGEAQGLLDNQTRAQEELQAAVEKYGFTIEELGPKYQQQELDKMAGQLLKEWELLNASGIEQVTILEKMGPAFLEYVNTAVATGAALPEQMRPIVDSLYAQGKLLHENGEAFTEAEYKGLSFTQSLTESMQSVIEEIRNLVAALTGVPNVTRTVTTVHQDVHQGGGGEPPEAARGAVILPFRPRHAQHGGIIPARTGGELIRAGEGGKTELIGPVEDMLRVMTDQAIRSAGAQPTVVTLVLDGRVIAEQVVRANQSGRVPVQAGSVRR